MVQIKKILAANIYLVEIYSGILYLRYYLTVSRHGV